MRIDRIFMRDMLNRPPDAVDGGKGSGNFGHKGRPGKVGGSGEGGGEEAEKSTDYTKKDSITALEERQKKADWDTKRDELISKNLTPEEAEELEDFEICYDSLRDAYNNIKCPAYDLATAVALYDKALNGGEIKRPMYYSPFAAIKEGLDTVEGIQSAVKKLRELRKSGAIIRDEDSEMATSFGMGDPVTSRYEMLCTAVDKCPDEAVRNMWDLMNPTVSVLNAKAAFGDYYYKFGQGINIDIERSMVDLGGYAPMEIAFHEVGHAIDNSLGEYLYYDKGTPPFTGQYSMFSTSWHDGEFVKTMESEVKDYIAKIEQETLEDFKAHLPYSPENAQYMYDKGYFTMVVNNEQVFNMLSEMELKEGCKAQVKNTLMRTLGYSPDNSESENRTVKIASEALAGFSGGKYCVGYGHEPSYYEGEEGRQFVAHEIFTELFTAAIVEPECATRFSKMFPKSYETYQRMMNEVFG